MFFNNLPQNDYQVSLNSAHRIRTSIMQSMRDSRKRVGMLMFEDRNQWNLVSISDILTKDTQQIIDQMKKNWNKTLDNEQLKFALNIDLNRMKEYIFEANILSGVSKLLNEVKNLKLEQNFLKGYDEEAKETDLTETINSLREYYQNKETVGDNEIISYNFHNPEDIDNRIKEINKEILANEEKIAELNASHKVTITLYDLTAEKIGLK